MHVSNGLLGYKRWSFGKFWSFWYCLLSFAFLIVLVIEDLLWTTHSEGLTFPHFLCQFIHTRLTYMLPLLCYLNFTFNNDAWQKLFSYKLWIVPFLTMMVYAFSGLPTYPWCVASVVEWSLLFLVLLFYYQKRNMDNFSSYVMSYLSVFLGSAIYEAPQIFSGYWLTLSFLLYYGLTFGIFLYLLYRFKVRLSWKLGLTSIPIMLEWIFYYQIRIEWLPRLSVFPLFLCLALKRRSELKEHDNQKA